MFSYVFMKILERRPSSYAGWMTRISAGRYGYIHESILSHLSGDSRVLEIGCGDGTLTAAMARKGMTVDAFDRSCNMVQIARRKVESENLSARVNLKTMGVAKMSALPKAGYTVVVASLVFSELSGDERRFAFKHAYRSLKPGGVMIIIDEVAPQSFFPRIVQTLFRIPVLAATYLLTGELTRPLVNLEAEAVQPGFEIIQSTFSHRGAIIHLQLQRPE